MGIKIRDKYNLTINIAKISKFIGGSNKVIYHIENNFEHHKAIRYLMYMRKKGLNVNKLLDFAIEEEKLSKKAAKLTTKTYISSGIDGQLENRSL